MLNCPLNRNGSDYGRDLPTDATLTVSTNQSGSFTAEFGSGDSSKKLTITGTNGSGTAEKYGVVYIKASKEGYASWTTTITVIEPAR